MFFLRRPALANAFALALFTGVVAPMCHAGVIVYQDPADVGNQAYTSSLVENFTVNLPVLVTALGVYDSGQDGIVGSISVAIVDSSQTLWTSATVSGTIGTLAGGDRFVNVAPVLLTPGAYALVTEGFSASDLNGNTTITSPGATPTTLDSDGGAITFTGINFGGGPQQYLPPSSYPPDIFNAGSFAIDQTFGTPEPASSVLLVLGFGFCAFARWKRRANR